jgi:hypothetical protein
MGSLCGLLPARYMAVDLRCLRIHACHVHSSDAAAQDAGLMNAVVSVGQLRLQADAAPTSAFLVDPSCQQLPYTSAIHSRSSKPAPDTAILVHTSHTCVHSQPAKTATYVASPMAGSLQQCLYAPSPSQHRSAPHSRVLAPHRKILVLSETNLLKTAASPNRDCCCQQPMVKLTFHCFACHTAPHVRHVTVGSRQHLQRCTGHTRAKRSLRPANEGANQGRGLLPSALHQRTPGAPPCGMDHAQDPPPPPPPSNRQSSHKGISQAHKVWHSTQGDKHSRKPVDAVRVGRPASSAPSSSHRSSQLTQSSGCQSG